MNKSRLFSCAQLCACFLLLPCFSAFAEDRIVIEREELTASLLASKLNLWAALYEFQLEFEDEDNAPQKFFVQFEHWKMGELQKVVKTEEFPIHTDQNFSLFLALPLSTKSLEALVSTPYLKDPNFRGELDLDIVADERHDDAGGFASLQEDQIRSLGKGDDLLLAYAIYGAAISNEIFVGDPRRNEPDAMQIELEAHNQIIVDNNLDFVETIACRLFVR